MDINDVKEVTHTDDKTIANKLLEEGWTLFYLGVQHIADTVQVGGDTFQLTNPIWMFGRAKEVQSPWKFARTVNNFPHAYRYLWAQFAREHEKVIRVMPDPDNNSLDVIVDAPNEEMANEVINAIQARFEQSFMPENNQTED